MSRTVAEVEDGTPTTDSNRKGVPRLLSKLVHVIYKSDCCGKHEFKDEPFCRSIFMYEQFFAVFDLPVDCFTLRIQKRYFPLHR